MKKDTKERAAAIFLGLIMIMSLAGFAAMNISFPTTEDTQGIPSVVDREMTPEEKIFVLRTGRVLMESFYSENCTECSELNILGETFANGFPEYFVFEKVKGNETRVQIIGQGGEIRELGTNLTEDELFDVFCDIAILQPKECLLREL